MDERKLRSKKQEKRVASELKGKTQPASGALWGAKADVRSDLFLVECKTTLKDYYQLSYNIWNKIYREAVKDGLRIPVMCIDLNGGKERVAVLRTDDLNGYPEPYALCIAQDLSNGKSTHRVRYAMGANRAFLNNPKGKSGFDICILPWDTFLERVVESYDIQ